MIRVCDDCQHKYDDVYKWTICPHMPLGAGPVPFHPVQNPSGYCKEHDLFACKRPKHRAFPIYDRTEEKMPANLRQAASDCLVRAFSPGVEPPQPHVTQAASIVLSIPEPELPQQPTTSTPGFFRPSGRPLSGIEGSVTDDMRPKTAGIPPATKGPLAVLQFEKGSGEPDIIDTIRKAAKEISSYHMPVADQAQRHRLLNLALEDFLVTIVQACPPGPERSTAISWARASKMFAAAAISLE